MFKIKSCLSTGVVEYVCTTIKDINALPKSGIAIGSSAQLINSEGLRVFMFTQDDENIDGQWIELV